MKNLFHEAADAIDAALAVRDNAHMLKPGVEPDWDALRRLSKRLKGIELDKRIFLDASAIHKRAAGADWYLNLDVTGRLMIVFRKRNVIELIDAASFRLSPEAGNGRVESNMKPAGV